MANSNKSFYFLCLLIRIEFVSDFDIDFGFAMIFGFLGCAGLKASEALPWC